MDARARVSPRVVSHVSAHILESDVVGLRNDTLPNDAPRIALVVSLNIPGMSDELAGIVRRFTRVTVEQLNELGARVVLFDSSRVDLIASDRVDECDGVLFLGGGDIDPSVYGHNVAVKNLYGVDRAADDYSIDIIRSTINRDAPLFCICRGSQLLNVALGGDIIPDIEDFELHRGGRGAPMFKDETLSLIPGSKVHDIFGSDRLTVRSGHHQAVNRVAEPLVVTARADDGVVEGTELPGAHWVVGVQWHPEDDDGSADDRRRLFSAFLDAVRAQVASRAPASN